MGQTLDCFCKGIESTQSHRPEEAIPDSYEKFEPGLTTPSFPTTFPSIRPILNCDVGLVESLIYSTRPTFIPVSVRSGSSFCFSSSSRKYSLIYLVLKCFRRQIFSVAQLAQRFSPAMQIFPCSLTVKTINFKRNE